MTNRRIDAFAKALATEVSRLDALRSRADKLHAAGVIDDRKRDELVDVLNDVAVGVSDLAARLTH